MTQTQTCPFCVEPITGDVTNCPHCGQFLGEPVQESDLDDQPEIEQAAIDERVSDFVAAYLRGAELSGAYLSGADLFHASLVAADLSGADLGEANLCNADLSRADLKGANLLGADLSDARLNGADLREATLIGADLRGAVYDEFTLWPENFDPQTRGATRAGKRK